ncbi:MAG TPA: hypothetical protein VK456_11715 [Xanthobacteraceae bacterium]|nr:hypothetical protein [Xanthobacteraceae bacterium]
MPRTASAGPARERRPSAAARSAATPSGATTALRLVKPGGTIQVRGPVTGQLYSFTTTAPVQQVDARDAASLARTSWFRPA